MNMIEARQLLTQMRLHSFPHMKDEDRDQWHEATLLDAFPPSQEIVNPTEMASDYEMPAAEPLNQLRALFNV